MMVTPSGVQEHGSSSQAPRRASAPSQRSRDTYIHSTSIDPGNALDAEPEIFPIPSDLIPSEELSPEILKTASPIHVQSESSTRSGESTPRGTNPRSLSPSGLSILLARQRKLPAFHEGQKPSKTQTPKGKRSMSPVPESPISPLSRESSTFTPAPVQSIMAYRRQSTSELSESAPLLNSLQAPSYTTAYQPSSKSMLSRAKMRLQSITSRQSLGNTALVAITSLPAVLLGSLLNILDGVSCEHAIH